MKKFLAMLTASQLLVAVAYADPEIIVIVNPDQGPGVGPVPR
jgi:hypothetical protein